MLPENIQYILMFIGALTCAFMAVCMLCATGLIVFLVWDGYVSRRQKAFQAKHQSPKLYSLPGGNGLWTKDTPFTQTEKDAIKAKQTGRHTDETTVYPAAVFPSVSFDREEPNSESIGRYPLL